MNEQSTNTWTNNMLVEEHACRNSKLIEYSKDKDANLTAEK